MVSYRLQLIRDGSGASQAITGRLSGNLWSLLGAFREQATRLSASEWVQADCPGSWRLSSAGVEEQDAPSPTAIAATLHLLRPFVLQSETLYFPKFTSQLYLEINDTLARKVISRNVAMFSCKDMRAVYRVIGNDLVLNTEYAVDLWLDAFEYHPYGKKTPERRQRFIDTYGRPPDSLARAVFRDMLRAKVFAILNMADFAEAFKAAEEAM